MSFARLRAVAAGARRGPSILLIAAAAFAALTVPIVANSGGSAEAAEAAGPACGDRASASLSMVGDGPLAARGDDDPVVEAPFDVTSFLRSRIGGAGVEWIAGLGFSWFGEITGLKKAILPNTPERQTLRKLEQMKEQLDDISKRLDEVSASIASVMAELREGRFKQELKELCMIAADQRGAFKRYAVAIRAGVKLGLVLTKDPALADAKTEAANRPWKRRSRRRRTSTISTTPARGWNRGSPRCARRWSRGANRKRSSSSTARCC